MLSLLIFFVIIPFLVEATDSDPAITFKIQLEVSNGLPILSCDHRRESVDKNLYTVYEGRNFRIATKYDKTINHILCHAATDEKKAFEYIKKTIGDTEITFRGEKSMGTEWKCKILAHRDTAAMKPVIQYNNYDYSAAYCYMKIHVRQKEAPQSIVVNNMEMQAVRTNLSVKDVDFIAEYQYEDGDAVKVICFNQQNKPIQNKTLSMEYKMAGTMSDASTMDDLTSSKTIVLSTRLHSGHDNSYIICTHKEDDDYTKVMVRFIKRTKYSKGKTYVLRNILLKETAPLDTVATSKLSPELRTLIYRDNIGISINGMLLPPHLTNAPNNNYEIEYKYYAHQIINVTCEVKRPDVTFMVIDDDLKNVSSYKKTETRGNAAMMVFQLSHKDDKTLTCAIDYINGTFAEQVSIHFTEAYPIEKFHGMRMKLQSNGTVMELYNDKLKVIFYEFKDGETLNLTCAKHQVHSSPGFLYLELESKKCETNGCYIFKTLTVTRDNENKTISCYLKDEFDLIYRYRTRDTVHHESRVHREIRVILREKVLATTTAITTTTIAANTKHSAANPASKILTDVKESATPDTNCKSSLLLGSFIGAVLTFIAGTVTIVCCIRSRKSNHIGNPGECSNKTDISTSEHIKENENQYDLCDQQSNRESMSYNTPGGVDNIDPKDHQYTEIDYLSCKPKIGEKHTRNSRVYDEPYVHIHTSDII